MALSLARSRLIEAAAEIMGEPDPDESGVPARRAGAMRPAVSRAVRP